MRSGYFIPSAVKPQVPVEIQNPTTVSSPDTPPQTTAISSQTVSSVETTQSSQASQLETVATFLVGTNEFLAGNRGLGASNQEFMEISGMSPA